MPVFLRGLSLAALLILAWPVTGALAAEYYVDCENGSGRQNGSITAPWNSIRQVNAQLFQPGDTIYFKRGCLWQTRRQAGLRAWWSGTQEAPITFSAYGSGERPRIHNLSGRTFSKQIEITGHYQVFEYLDLYAAPPPGNPRAVRCKNAPEGVGWLVGFSIDGRASHNTIRYSKISGFTSGVHFNGGPSNKLLNSQLIGNVTMSENSYAPGPYGDDNDSGAMAVTLNSSHNEIAYNYFSGNNSTCSEDYGNAEGASIEVYNGSHNQIHHNISFNENTFAELGGDARNNVFAYNVYYNRKAYANEFLNVRGGGKWGVHLGTKAFNNTVFIDRTDLDTVLLVCAPDCSPQVLEFRNNVVVSNSTSSRKSAIWVEGSWAASHNVFWTDTGASMHGAQGGEVAVQDPGFVDADTGDLRLADVIPGSGDHVRLSTLGGEFDKDVTCTEVGSAMAIGAFSPNAPPLDLTQPPAWTVSAEHNRCNPD